MIRPNTFAIPAEGSISYQVDDFGVIHQLDPTPIAYDEAYLAQHTAKPNYKENSLLLNGLRLGFLVGSLGHVPRILLDYGYGDGSFAAFAARIVPGVYVYDVGEYPVPSVCTRTRNPEKIPADVVTYWDVLEHVPVLEDALKVNAQYIALSVPCLPHISVFENWKHRRPNEHLHHFTARSLDFWMTEHGWDMEASAHLEEAVRSDIITALFKRRV